MALLKENVENQQQVYRMALMRLILVRCLPAIFVDERMQVFSKSQVVLEWAFQTQFDWLMIATGSFNYFRFIIFFRIKDNQTRLRSARFHSPFTFSPRPLKKFWDFKFLSCVCLIDIEITVHRIVQYASFDGGKIFWVYSSGSSPKVIGCSRHKIGTSKVVFLRLYCAGYIWALYVRYGSCYFQIYMKIYIYYNYLRLEIVERASARLDTPDI